MNNLNDVIADLDILAESYRVRAAYGQDERTAAERYNGEQFACFANAAAMLRRAVEAHHKYHRPLFEVIAEFDVDADAA